MLAELLRWLMTETGLGTCKDTWLQWLGCDVFRGCGIMR